MKNYLLFNFSLYTNLLRMKRSIDTVCPLNPSQDVSQNPGIIDLVSTASCRWVTIDLDGIMIGGD